MKAVYATRTCAVAWKPRAIQVTAGEAWDPTDPFVKANPELFTAEPGKLRRTVPAPPVVEAATANPGERRSTSRG